MEKKQKKQSKILFLLKSLLAGYILTGGLLLLLALALYKFDLTEQKVTAGIMAVYLVSTMAGGFVMGKYMKIRRFFWGLVVGILYFLLLLAVSVGVNHELQSNGISMIVSVLLCSSGGMIGGMIS